MSSAGSDKLVPIPPSDWEKLRNMFSPDWPRNIYAYYLINNYLSWLKRDSKLQNLTFYSLNGDWTDGTFVVVDRYQLFVNTLDETEERLKRLLRLLDWNKAYQVHAVLKRHRETVLQVIKEKKLPIEYEFHTVMQYMPKEDAIKLKIDPPEGITLKPMTTMEHAITANKKWQFHDDGSLFFIKRMLDWNQNCGAFNEKDELVAWCFRFQFGGLGVLHVTDKYKRQGIGTQIVKYMAKQLAEKGCDCIASVVTHNMPSLSMFQKMGFCQIDEVSWITCAPLVPCQWVD